jgi:hypothetical protein
MMTDFKAGEKPTLYEVVKDGFRYITTDAPDGTEESVAEYRRADPPPTLDAALELPEVKALVEAGQALLDLNDNHSPFGGEMYRDRVDRTWDNFRAALAQIKEPKP